MNYPAPQIEVVANDIPNPFEENNECGESQAPKSSCKYFNISDDTQIHGYTQMLHNRVTSAARERAQRAQRAKRRKDTVNSHEQLQGAPFSSVRRHVPASLIIITRFPFTYQTGFQRGSKKVLFFGIDFCIDFGVDLGSYFGLKFDVFRFFFALIFWL